MTIKCDIWCYTLRQEEEEAWGCTGVADHYQCQASLFCLHTLYHHPRQHHQHVFRSLNGKTKIMQQTNKWCSWSSQKTFLRWRWQWASIGHFVFLFVMQWEISINCNDDDSVFFYDDSIDKGTGVLDQYQCQVSRPSCGNRPLTYPSKHVLHLPAINTLQHSSNPGLQYIVYKTKFDFLIARSQVSY